MRCPECGEVAADARLKYCENCGGKMPVSQVATGSRPALRPTRTSEQPAYAAEILEEEEEFRSPRAQRAQAARPGTTEDEGESTDPGSTVPYDGPRWLKDVPGHSASVVGVGLVVLAVGLSILPFFAGVGVLASLLVVLGGVALVARELRESGDGSGWVESVPAVLLRPEVPAGYALLLAALAVRMLGLGITPLLWVAGAGLVCFDQYRKVYAGPDGVGRRFDPLQVLRFPSVVALAGVALCLATLYLPWLHVTAGGAEVPGNAPVPGGEARQGPPELRVVDTPRASDDSLYSAYGGVSVSSGWDLPGSLLPELVLLAALLVLALREEEERPAWLRFVPAGAVGVSLLWALFHMKLAVGPIAFVFGLGAVGFVAVRTVLDGRPAAAPAQDYADEPAYEDDPPPEADAAER